LNDRPFKIFDNAGNQEDFEYLYTIVEPDENRDTTSMSNSESHGIVEEKFRIYSDEG